MKFAQCKRKSCGIHCDIWIKSMNSEGKGRSVGRSDKLKSMNSEGKGRSVGRSVGRLLGLPKLMKYRLLGPKCRVYTLRKGFTT